MRSKRIAVAGIIVVLAVLAGIGMPVVGTSAATTSSTLTITGLSGGNDQRSFNATWFNYSLGNSAEIGGGGGGAGKAVAGPLVVRHALKGAQGLILQAASEGRHLPKVKLVVRRSDKTIATIVLTDALISKSELKGKAGNPATTFVYAKIDANLSGGKFCFNFQTNTKC